MPAVPEMLDVPFQNSKVALCVLLCDQEYVQHAGILLLHGNSVPKDKVLGGVHPQIVGVIRYLVSKQGRFLAFLRLRPWHHTLWHVYQRHAARLRQQPQGRPGQSSPASRICHQQYRLDARRRLDAGAHPHLPTRRLTTTSPPASRRRITRSGCASCSLWRRPTGRRSPTRAASTWCFRSATACCCGPRSCSTPPTLVSCARGGTVTFKFTLLACPRPKFSNAYTLVLPRPRRIRCSPTVNVDRLKPFFEPVGARQARGPSSTRDRRACMRRRMRGVTIFPNRLYSS